MFGIGGWKQVGATFDRKRRKIKQVFSGNERPE